MLSTLKFCGSKLKTGYIMKCVLRPYMQVSSRMEKIYKKIDKVPDTVELIYNYSEEMKFSFMYHTMNILTIFTTVNTIIMGYNKVLYTIHPNAIYMISMFGFYLWCIVCLQNIRRSFPIRIYYNEKQQEYIALFLRMSPFKFEYYKLPMNSLTFINSEKKFKLQMTIFKHKSRHLILHKESFKTDDHFSGLLKPQNN